MTEKEVTAPRSSVLPEPQTTAMTAATETSTYKLTRIDTLLEVSRVEVKCEEMLRSLLSEVGNPVLEDKLRRVINAYVEAKVHTKMDIFVNMAVNSHLPEVKKAVETLNKITG